MCAFPVPLTITDILSKAPGNPVLWHLFLAELARAMTCDGGFLAIADLGGGDVHPLYQHNVAPEQYTGFERGLREAGSFAARVAQVPHRVCGAPLLDASLCREPSGSRPEATGDDCRFGVSLPLSRRYAYCLMLLGGRPAAAKMQGHVRRLQALVPPLQNALQKEQWFSLYHQITLLTGKHVAAYIIVDRALNVLFSDPVFNRIIAEMNCVEIRGKRLTFPNKAIEQRVLASMVGIAYATVTMQNPCVTCDMTVIPARALDNLYAWEFYKQGVVLTFTRAHENDPTLVRLMALYSLTKGEALCALHYIATPSITDIAAGTHRSPETVRNHVKSIMQKLEVHNQGALMKKLLAIAAL